MQLVTALHLSPQSKDVFTPVELSLGLLWWSMTPQLWWETTDGSTQSASKAETQRMLDGGSLVSPTMVSKNASAAKSGENKD
jgi:hypothetical protein